MDDDPRAKTIAADWDGMWAGDPHLNWYLGGFLWTATDKRLRATGAAAAAQQPQQQQQERRSPAGGAGGATGSAGQDAEAEDAAVRAAALSVLQAAAAVPDGTAADEKVLGVWVEDPPWRRRAAAAEGGGEGAAEEEEEQPGLPVVADALAALVLGVSSVSFEASAAATAV